MYSSIVRKPCKCGCGKPPTMGYAGYNENCRPDLKEEKIKKQQQKNTLAREKGSVRSLIGTDTNRGITNNNMGDNKILQAEMALYWFTAEREIAKNPVCMECSAPIPKKFYRAATAHIFPKSIFPSVMANLNNRLFIGAGCGCHNKTHRLDTFSEMKVFPLAVERFNKFKHLITEKHKYLDAFINYANGTI